MITTRATPPPTYHSNRELAAALGCDFTTVSRLRNGIRIPGIALTARIIEVFELDEVDRGELLGAMCAGPAECGAWLNARCFGTAPVSA